jgi:phospholipid transport system substrate-binding protein
MKSILSLKFLLICGLVASVSPVSVYAEPEADMTSEIAAAEVDGARAFVNGISKRVIDVINRTDIGDDGKEEKLVELFESHVDTDWMGEFVLGRFNRTITAAQKEKYLKLYHVYLVRSYVPRFQEYGSRELNILRINSKGDGDYLVKMNLTGAADMPEISVDYRIRKDLAGQFKLVDVVGEGISMIATQRSDFGGLLSRKGVDYFNEKLEKKVNKLMAGKK